MRQHLFVLQQWLVDCFGCPDEGDHPEQIRRGQDHCGQTKARDGGYSFQLLSQGAEKKNSEGGDITANVVAKAGAGRAKSGREQFRKVNRVAAERGERAKTQNRPEIPNLLWLMKRGEG